MPPAEQHTDNRAPATDEQIPSAYRSGGTDESLTGQVREVVTILRDLLIPKQDDPDRLFTAEELGALFHLSPRTLKDQAAAGMIAHHRFGKH